MKWKYSLWSMGLSLLMLLSHGQAAADDVANELSSAGFEAAVDGKLAAWRPYGRGYTIDRTTRHSGKQSIRCASKGPRDGMGAVQVIAYPKPDKRPVIVGGWCKTKAVGGNGDCCVYLDIIYDDGTPWWGKRNHWRLGTHDWEYNANVYYPAKPIREIRTYVFLRRTTGTAWFDDVKVCRGGLHLASVHVASDFPRTKRGIRVSAELTRSAKWECQLADERGGLLDSCRGTGRRIDWLSSNPRGITPSAFRIRAADRAGSKLEFATDVHLPRRPKNPVRRGYTVWMRNPMKKIYPTEFPESAQAPRSYSLSLARNEHEGFQIAITSSDDVNLKDVQVRVGPLVNAAGDVFPNDCIGWHVVGYVWVQNPSGHPLAPDHPNWCPEVLLPPRPFDVPGGRTQTVWVDIHATRTVRPSVYRGTLAVAPSTRKPTEVRINVKVFPFALPKSPHMKTAFAMMDGFLRHTYGKITPKLRRRSLDIMLDHRLNPDDISRTNPPRIEDLLYARKRGMNAFNILNLVPKPKGNPLWVCWAPISAYGPNFNNELAKRLDPYVAQLRKHGLAKIAYVYGFDERGADFDELIKRICKFVKERYPEVSTFTTARYMYRKRAEVPLDYQDDMDWYCPLTRAYDPKLSAKLRTVGKQVWWYVCCGPRYPYANFSSMDYPAIEGRLLAWMTFGYKADGLLYWHVNYWHNNGVIDWHDPYLADWQPTCIANMTGDGILTYPTPSGPVSSIRLENIRDGLEDYDYLCLLAEAKGRGEAMKCFSALVKNMTEFTRSPDALCRVRDSIAEQIGNVLQRKR